MGKEFLWEKFKFERIIEPWCLENRRGIGGGVVVKAQCTNLPYNPEQMMYVCQQLCGLTLLLLLVQEVRSCSHLYQNGMLALTKMGGGWRRFKVMTAYGSNLFPLS